MSIFRNLLKKHIPPYKSKIYIYISLYDPSKVGVVYLTLIILCCSVTMENCIVERFFRTEVRNNKKFQLKLIIQHTTDLTVISIDNTLEHVYVIYKNLKDSDSSICRFNFHYTAEILILLVNRNTVTFGNRSFHILCILSLILSLKSKVIIRV